MLSLKINLKKIYNKTSVFCKIYAVTSGITYYYVPEVRNTLTINTCALLGATLVDNLENYVKHIYPD